MPRLNQIIAVAAGKKTNAATTLTRLQQQVQKPAQLEGITRTYRRKDEDGELFPPEKKLVQLKLMTALREAQDVLGGHWDAVATQETANTQAKADVKVNGQTVLPQVPVCVLLFLEKQLAELHALVEKLPTLDPAETWTYNPEADCYASEPYETTKTRKVLKNHVKYEATKEHPAQVETYQEDVVIGYWTAVKFSGSLPAREKNETLERIRQLQEAVKFAREEANTVEVKPRPIAREVFGFVFGD